MSVMGKHSITSDISPLTLYVSKLEDKNGVSRDGITNKFLVCVKEVPNIQIGFHFTMFLINKILLS